MGALEQQARLSAREARTRGADTVKLHDVPDLAYQALRRQFDPHHGGWGSAPKFPQPMTLEFLLRYHHATGDAHALEMVAQTLTAMARGGIYDQLGGGFHRYAVDANWLTPHFEKMLYDNAQLARAYLHTWQVTGEPLFRAVVEETLDYVMREMTSSEGGFYATQDADTEGEEGKFYVWTVDEVREALGGSATRILELYGVSEDGNFEGKNILTFNGTFEERQLIAGARRQLFEARERRTRPGCDEKVLTSWNGLMLAAFAEAARVLDNDTYRQAAEQNADLLLRSLRTPEGRLWHVWYGDEATVQGLLEDYTHLIEGLLALYQTSFESRWYAAAQELVDAMWVHFSASPNGQDESVGFYDTADDAQDLVVRPRELQDNAVPSGNAMAATVLQKLARFAHEPRYEVHARRILEAMAELMGQHPLAFGQWLVALDDALAPPVEVAVVGDLDVEATQALIREAQRAYAPHQLLAAGSGAAPALLAHREQLEGRPTAYVCRDEMCHPPVTDPDALRGILS